MKKLYDAYFSELDTLVDMELKGETSDCWDHVTGMLAPGS